MTHDQRNPITIPIDTLRAEAASIADALRNAPSSALPTGGGSRHRGLPEELRARFIEVRSALFQRGIFDPLLVRFDTASAPQATNDEIAEQLGTIAQSLQTGA